uniref:Uncharacterized protein n=1 Tax=Pseudo-nitzschia australis TaxID=44445 RepID=A0A7S4AI92_9STRA
MCGATAGSGDRGSAPFHKTLTESVLEPWVRNLANKERCSDLVVFGEAFGVDMEKLLPALELNTFQSRAKSLFSIKRSKMHLRHGNCFFLFVLEDDLQEGVKHTKVKVRTETSASTSTSTSTSLNNNNNSTNAVRMVGQYFLIPVDRNILPYVSIRRNAKLFQYSAQFLFPDARTIVFQDINFLAPSYSNRLPEDYHKLYPRNANTNANTEPCLTVFSLPKNSQTVGEKNTGDDLFQGHCKLVLNKLAKRTQEEGISIFPGNDNTAASTLNTASLIQQCDAYLQYVYKRELTTDVLSHGMVDTNFISWNEGSAYCRDFNARLRCTILDQLHCHSDRDRIVFPFALYLRHQAGLSASTSPTMEYQPKDSKVHRQPVNTGFQQVVHDLHFVQNNGVTEAAASSSSSNANTNTNKNSNAGDGDGDGAAAAVKQDTVLILRNKYHWTQKTIGTSIPKRRRGKKK